MNGRVYKLKMLVTELKMVAVDLETIAAELDKADTDKDNCGPFPWNSQNPIVSPFSSGILGPCPCPFGQPTNKKTVTGSTFRRTYLHTENQQRTPAKEAEKKDKTNKVTNRFDHNDGVCCDFTPMSSRRCACVSGHGSRQQPIDPPLQATKTTEVTPHVCTCGSGHGTPQQPFDPPSQATKTTGGDKSKK